MSTPPPSDRPKTRQELYDRIRETSKEEFILEDMIRLGFWPAQGDLPQDPADEIRRRGEIGRELEALRTEGRRLHNEQALIKELRKRRMEESRQKRRETTERNERLRKERAAAWREAQSRDITYLGEGVSAGLGQVGGDEARLRAAGLPVLMTAPQVAAAMGISVGALRFLAFSRKTATVSHYVRFKLKKKTGGERLISAPMPRLKAAQAWVLGEVLGRVPLHDAAHGFRAERSIVTNARPHVGREVVVNVDLKDFFPTVGYRRVKGLFQSLGYSEAAATLFALLCTEPDVEEVVLDGKTYFVALTGRHLPQGAPSSPAVTNLLCRRLDRRLEKMAAGLGFTYTRYADDLTFSAGKEAAPRAGEVLSRMRGIVAHEGFVVHPDKTRVLRRGGRQEVTGIVVNDRPGVSRETLRRFRATLYQIEKDGPAGKRWGRSPDVISAILGFADYVSMVSPDRGAALLGQVRGIIAKHGWQRPRTPRKGKVPAAVPPQAPQQDAAAPGPAKPEAAEKKKWWKLW